MTKEAISFLSSNGWKIYDNGTLKDWLKDKRRYYRTAKVGTPKRKDIYYRVWWGKTFWGVLNSRELVKLYQGEKQSHSAVSKRVKSTKRRSRAATKRAVQQEKFDDIPTNGELKTG